MNNKEIIIHCIDSLRLGGAEILLKNTINLLPEYKHIVVYLIEPNLIKPFTTDAVEFVCLQHNSKKDTFRTIWKLRKLINHHKPLLVHSHLFYSSLYARIATPSFIPLVFTVHSLYSIDAFQQNALSKWVEQQTIRKGHVLVTVSKSVLEDYLRYVAFKGKKFVLYNFLPQTYFHKKELSANTGSLRCVAIGNLKEAKNYTYLLDVFAHIKNQDITLDIYGYGHLKKSLEDAITRRNLKITIYEQAVNIPELLRGYDLFIQASQHEGYGLSVIEAIASGLPVLISDIPVFREVTKDLAHFFPLDDSAGAAQMIMTLKSNPDKRNQFVDAAFDYISTAASETTYKRKLSGIYKDMVNSKSVNAYVEALS